MSRYTTEDLVWRRPFCIALLLLALPLLYLAGGQLLAGIASVQGEMFLQDWEQKRTAPSERAWQVAFEAANRSNSLLPIDNGEYLDRLGRVNEWQGVFKPFGDVESIESRRDALTAYRQAAQLRPLWPHTWAQLAYIKLRLLEFDKEFDQALLQADRLGPWRMSVQAQLAEIGMIAWPQLDQQQRRSVWMSLQKTLMYDAARTRPLVQLARDAGLYRQMCLTLDERLLAERKLCTR
ncbi:hypothetical protein GCM10009104_18600 [Marinobacterium maritimum]|uniref:Uncharacterized protein n=1 Tax=Marinobacterium maritimum TaxID=500162 RepID=A0ABP3TE99_9GAMM